MPGLLRDRLTGELVLSAPERELRPNAFGEPVTARSPESCPFCPGHEWETPPESARIGGEKWTARSFPNRYPGFPASFETAAANEGQARAAGIHEVIVESREHDLQFVEMEGESLAGVARFWRERYAANRTMAGVRYLLLFKNRGAGSGESIPHPHSQLVGLPIVPEPMEREADLFRKCCPFCESWMEGSEALTVSDDAHFVTLVPRAGRFTYEQWIVPKRHAPAFDGSSDDEIASLAAALRDAVARLDAIAGSPAAFNWEFRNAPLRNGAGYHWYVRIHPRLTGIGGFEIATGIFINVVDPETAAERLRSV